MYDHLYKEEAELVDWARSTDMTLLIDDRSPGPGTHAIVIGVGGYAHLQDAPPENHRIDELSIGDLPSPKHSVAQFASWMQGREGFNNPAKPLRSLDVFCSSPHDEDPLEIDGTRICQAHSQQVFSAIKAWKERSDRNPDNLAIFFFCGHGMSYSQSENILMLEDFGANPYEPTDTALLFDEFRIGMSATGAARNQIYFVDACRTAPPATFTAKYGECQAARVIGSGRINSSIRDKSCPVYFAAGLGTSSYGKDGQPTTFTQGLLKSLEGSASREVDDEWHVVASTLGEGISRCVASLDVPEPAHQFCEATFGGPGITFHHVRGLPRSVVRLSTKNPAHLGTTTLSHRHVTAHEPIERQPVDSPWWVDIVHGNCDFNARFEDGRVSAKTKHVAPPGMDLSL